MNAQIKAIGSQAGLVFIENAVYGQRWYSSTCGLDSDEYQKLVKLVVQECAQVSLKSSHRSDDMGAIIARKIQQHFGVTE